MVGGETTVYEQLVPFLSVIAQPEGFGHFVEVVHNAQDTTVANKVVAALRQGFGGRTNVERIQ